MLEQHPVPQNVTSFQFRLIGDMTLKQFGYLAGGAILAYLAYHLPLPFFFTWPLTALFALGGIGFAFVPVEERPMDVWFLSFIKSVYSPTLYIWQREAPTPVLSTQPIKSTASSSMSTSPPVATTSRPVANSQNMWQNFFMKKQQQKQPTTPAVIPQTPYASVLASAPIPTVKSPSVSQPTEPPPPVSPTVVEQPRQAPLQPAPPIAPQHVEETKQPSGLEKKLEDALADKQRLEQELAAIRQMLMAQQKPSAPVPEEEKKEYVPAPQRMAYPNVITGTVRQQTGELLSNILVTVKDKDDIPLRALKTNKTGQFASSTSLPNGTYNIEVEDPKSMFSFQPVTVTLDGGTLEPIIVIAKTKQDLERQKLSDALFGNKS